MKIIEYNCEGKMNDAALNEDAIIVSNDCIAVIDGATSCKAIDGKPGGLLARYILEKRLLSGIDNKLDGFNNILKLNSSLFKAQMHDQHRFSDPSKRLMASVLIYSVEHKQIWSYGDCRFLVNGTLHYYNKQIDAMNALLRSFVNQAQLCSGASIFDLLNHDLGAEAIRPFIDLQPIFANRSSYFGYPILDGGNLIKEFFECVQVASGDEVVFSTDGYPILCPTLAESESELKRILYEDPLCITNTRSVKGCYPGMNSFDDRTYCRFIV